MKTAFSQDVGIRFARNQARPGRVGRGHAAGR